MLTDGVQLVIHTLGWTLLHFLWQGTLIALIAAAVLRLLRREAAPVRYAITSMAMLAMIAVPLFTGAVLHASGGAGADGVAHHVPLASEAVSHAAVSVDRPSGAAPTGGLATAVERRLAAWFDVASLLHAVVGVWLAGVLILSVQLLGGWWSVGSLRRAAWPSSPQWQQRVQELARRVAITKPVVLLESLAVQVPTAIGWLRPVILLPVSTTMGLTPQQLDLILLHELAHIRRHDYLVNLLQQTVRTLLFFHPGVWWLSRRMAEEREHCCDDMAASASGALPYAEALLRLEEHRGVPVRLAMAANGMPLLARVQRLLAPRTPVSNAMRAASGMLLVVSLGSGAVLQRHVHESVVPHGASDATPASPEGLHLSEGPATAASSPVAPAATGATAPEAAVVLRGSDTADSRAGTVPAEATAPPATAAPGSMRFVIVVAGNTGIDDVTSIVRALATHSVTAVYVTNDRETLSAARPLADRLDVARISYDYDRAEPERVARNLLGSGGLERISGRTAVIVVPPEGRAAILREAHRAGTAEGELGSTGALVFRSD